MRAILFAVVVALFGCGNSKGCESSKERAAQRLGKDAHCVGPRNYCSDENVVVYCNAQGKHWACDCGSCIVVEAFRMEAP